MIRPGVTPWMKQPDDLTSLWIDSSQVRPFTQVAVRTRKGQVIGVVTATMLPWDDVLARTD